ncbi:hypothetical protein FQA39_LY02337 [Lamprigera yunnana]|nr:hypothetical protein FQA39_LY02337 [Lamprigera yunnana]
MTKFLVFVALFALARAAVLPVAPGAVLPKDFEYDPHPVYSYDYKVEDPITGDFKTHAESRDGDVVKGKYTMIEADGSERIVDYFADAVNGFNAVVSNSATGVVSHGLIAKASPAAVPVPAAPVVAAKLAPKVFAPVHAAIHAAAPVPASVARISAPYNFGHFGYPHAGYGNQYSPYGGYPYSAGFHPRYY